jgi:hypothetical protein
MWRAAGDKSEENNRMTITGYRENKREGQSVEFKLLVSCGRLPINFRACSQRQARKRGEPAVGQLRATALHWTLLYSHYSDGRAFRVIPVICVSRATSSISATKCNQELIFKFLQYNYWPLLLLSGLYEQRRLKTHFKFLVLILGKFPVFLFFLMYLILPATLCSRVCSVSNRNEYQKQKNKVSREQSAADA